MEETNNVFVIYCECGKNIDYACHPDYVDSDEILNAVKEGRKMETITLEQHKQLKMFCRDDETCGKTA